MSEKKNIPTVWLVRPRHMIWLLLMAFLFGTFWMMGTPHLKFYYHYQGNDFYRIYIWCDYLGLHSRRVWPEDGKCPVIRLLQPLPERKG